MLTSLSMTNSLKTTSLVAKNLENLVNAKYRYQNEKVKKIYFNSKKSQQKTDADRKNARKGVSFASRKVKPSENSKLNLYPLLEGDYNLEEKNLLLKTFKNLIHELYKNELFYKEKQSTNSNFLHIFVNQIVNGLKKEKSLAKVHFSNPEDRKFFLMLCKGSSDDNKIHSLLDYICLKKIEKGPFISFKYMPIPLLNAFFGDKLSKDILEREKELYFEGKTSARLSEEDLRAILKGLEYDVHINFLLFKDVKSKSHQEYIKLGGGSLITLGQGQEDL
jgi:hypothetical protein